VELRHLRYFVTLAGELHFRRAAERLHIAQPALSQQIRQLEDEVQVKLLLRTTRQVQLTDAGRTFLPEARRILGDLDRATRLARLTGRGESGVLTIGCTEAAEISVLPRALAAFRKAAPGVTLAVESLTTSDQVQALRDGRIQLGFLRLPCEDSALLAVERVWREPMLVVLPESHPLALRRRIPLTALADQPVISFPRRLAPGFYDSLMGFCHRAGVTLRVVKEVEHFQAQQTLIALGFGVALQPASLRSVTRRGLVYRPLHGPTPLADIGMAYRRDGRSEVLEGFLRVVRQVFRKGADARGRARRGTPARR
jgi:DNA-binding transcriptional LysR family regulator